MILWYDFLQYDITKKKDTTYCPDTTNLDHNHMVAQIIVWERSTYK